MKTIDVVAKELHMKSSELLNESIRYYLEKMFLKIEGDIFLLIKKYGVKNVFEFDAKIKNGIFNEKEVYEDYFLLDNLEAERENIKNLLEKI